MNTSLRQRLKANELLIGTMVTLNSREVAEVLADVGFDWLCFDGEHGAIDVTNSLQGLLQAARGESACIVRVPALDEAAIKHVLDSGATGVMVPQVHTAEQAAQAVRWAHYPPEGTRGMGIARAQGYGFRVAEYLESADANTVVIVQAESAQAVGEIDAIAQVPGVDAVLIGPYDLSASLGHPGDLSHPDVQGAIARIGEACRAHQMPVGIFGMNAAAVKPFMAQGFRLMLIGVDAALLGQAARELLRSTSDQA